jgi:hypothetical protein
LAGKTRQRGLQRPAGGQDLSRRALQLAGSREGRPLLRRRRGEAALQPRQRAGPQHLGDVVKGVEDLPASSQGQPCSAKWSFVAAMVVPRSDLDDGGAAGGSVRALLETSLILLMNFS